MHLNSESQDFAAALETVDNPSAMNTTDIITGCPETSVTNYQTTMRNIPEERRYHRYVYINICKGKVSLQHCRINGDHGGLFFFQTSDEDFKLLVSFSNKAK
jgi:hypothetical protein